LLNLETRWIEEDGPKEPDSSEVIERLGTVCEHSKFLSGGLANHNYDLGDERILRIYKRSPQNSTLELESKLNDSQWKSFETAATLGRGTDYLVQKKLYFHELEDSSEHGKVAGNSIGEMHSTKPSMVTGHNEFLSTLFTTPRLSDVITDKLVWAVNSKDSLHTLYKNWLITELRLVIQENSLQIDEASSDKVLLHGDCKPSNIKKSSQSLGAVVFDWEFSFFGPRLIDIGHFLRWGVSSGFLDRFLFHYKGKTGVDLSGKLLTAKLIDIVNLSFQLAKSHEGSSREVDILSYFEKLIPASAYANKPMLRTRKKTLVVG
jgi:thiamine kinase-like enzyme